MEMSRLVSHLVDDLRYGQRRLRKNAGSSTLAVLVLALGIGAGTAVFSVVDGVLLRPLEYHDPDRIVTFTSVFPVKGTRAPVVSLPDLMDWRAGTSTFSAVTYYRKSRRAVTANEAAYFAQVVRTSPDFFTVLGVEPMMGRAFLPDEDAANGTVIISYDFWRNQMGGGGEILSQTLRLDNRTMTIAGVMPPGFAYPDA